MPRRADIKIVLLIVIVLVFRSVEWDHDQEYDHEHERTDPLDVFRDAAPPIQRSSNQGRPLCTSCSRGRRPRGINLGPQRRKMAT
jgi:hypothetical protein